jgi:hypothetical protein
MLFAPDHRSRLGYNSVGAGPGLQPDTGKITTASGLPRADFHARRWGGGFMAISSRRAGAVRISEAIERVGWLLYGEEWKARPSEREDWLFRNYMGTTTRELIPIFGAELGSEIARARDRIEEHLQQQLAAHRWFGEHDLSSKDGVWLDRAQFERAFEAAAAKAKMRKSKRGPVRGATGFAASDRKQFVLISRLLKKGAARSPYGAALMLADKIAGPGSAPNKAKRVAALYRKEHAADGR